MCDKSTDQGNKQKGARIAWYVQIVSVSPVARFKQKNEVGSEMHSEQRHSVLGIQANEREGGKDKHGRHTTLPPFFKNRKGEKQTLCGKR